MIRVQAEDFDPGAELAGFAQGDPGVGCVSQFLGLVRDLAGDSSVTAMTLEHYPGMAEKQLAALEAEARRRWPLSDVLIIHRHGRLNAGSRIVLVAAASAHRDAAFESCRFLMDWLKTRAPFWKVEHTADGDRWVGAKAGDDDAAARWEQSPP